MNINPNLSDKAQHDYELVVRARKGEQKAYAELLERYRDSIYFMLLKMVNNPSDAEDLTIEAFGKAFRNIEQYTPNYAFSTWLFKIATNNCIDFIRKKRGSMVSLDQTIAEDDALSHSDSLRADTLDPEMVLIKEQKVKVLRDIVSTLKPRYRKLVELRYFDELSYEEISIELSLPIGTVKAQLFRARELLFNILQKASESV